MQLVVFTFGPLLCVLPMMSVQVRADTHDVLSVFRFGGFMPDDSGGESAVPSVDFQLISLSRAVRGLNTVVTRDDILQSPSLIRTTIAPAFGIQDTSHVLNIMASAGFVTTLDVGIKLVTLAGLMRTNGHLIISGSTGTGDETCASAGAHFR